MSNLARAKTTGRTIAKPSAKRVTGKVTAKKLKSAPREKSERVTITLSPEQVALVRQYAEERTGGNVSAAFVEVLTNWQRQRAQAELVAEWDLKMTDAEREAIEAEWR